MPILDSRFVGLLRCPASQSPLREASLKELADLGLVADRCCGWDAGLLRADGGGAYPLRKGIPVLLTEELVPLRNTSGPSAVALSGA
jgi:uncharacterized protein YbaR (Trm112 family)